MQNISSIDDLKIAIQFLEAEQAIKGQQLKEQFLLTFDSLRPVNLLRSTLHDVVSSPNLRVDFLDTVIGLATGFLSKKIVVGASGNLIRKLFGSVLQFGVTNAVARHPGAIKAFSRFIIEHIFRKKEMNPNNP